MPETVTYNDDLKMIEVLSYDRVTGTDIATSIEAILNLIAETGSDKVFIDTLEQTAMPGAYTITKLASKMPTKVKFAVLANVEQPTYKEQKFHETVSFNRGISLKVFQSKDDVLAWFGS